MLDIPILKVLNKNSSNKIINDNKNKNKKCLPEYLENISNLWSFLWYISYFEIGSFQLKFHSKQDLFPLCLCFRGIFGSKRRIKFGVRKQLHRACQIWNIRYNKYHTYFIPYFVFYVQQYFFWALINFVLPVELDLQIDSIQFVTLAMPGGALESLQGIRLVT